MSLGDVDVVHTSAVKAQVNSVLVCLVTQVTCKWLLPGVGPKVALEVVRLGVPTTTNGTLERLFTRVGTDVHDQAFLVCKRFAAGRTDVWPVTTVGAAVLGQHAFRQEVGTTLTDKRSIAGVQSDVLGELGFLTKCATTHGAGKRPNAEMAQLVLRQLYLLDERLSTSTARKRTLPRVNFVVHAKRQRCGEILSADVAQERTIVDLGRVRRQEDRARLHVTRRTIGRFFQVGVKVHKTRALLMTC